MNNQNRISLLTKRIKDVDERRKDSLVLLPRDNRIRSNFVKLTKQVTYFFMNQSYQINVDHSLAF